MMARIRRRLSANHGRLQVEPDQRLQYFHNILRRNAQRYYVDRVKDYAISIEVAVEMVDKAYNSIVRQTRVKNYLNGLRVSNLMDVRTNAADALSKVYKVILKISRQVPATHRGDAHRAELLRRVVIGQTWVREPLSRMATNGLSFQELYGEL